MMALAIAKCGEISLANNSDAITNYSDMNLYV